MTLKIFLDTLSQPSRALLIFCRAANVQHELNIVQVMNQEHRTEEYAKITPFQTESSRECVPAALDDDKSLRDSAAILNYISDTRNIDDHWYPKEPLKRARVNEYLHWQHANTRGTCALYFRTRWLMPMLTQTPPKEERVASYAKKVKKTIQDIEQIWLENGKNKYITGDKISVADIMACCELEQPRIAGWNLRNESKILAEYMENVRGELNPHYDEAHKKLYDMEKQFNGDIPGVYEVSQKSKL